MCPRRKRHLVYSMSSKRKQFLREMNKVANELQRIREAKVAPRGATRSTIDRMMRLSNEKSIRRSNKSRAP